jgi:hypothetical protein
LIDSSVKKRFTLQVPLSETLAGSGIMHTHTHSNPARGYFKAFSQKVFVFFSFFFSILV